MRSAGKILIIVENLPVPFDRRVWMEATTLQRAGYEVSVICPTGKGYEKAYEELDGVHIYRHPMPPEGNGALGYLREYAVAIRWELQLAHKVWKERGFELVHICNPPDLLFLVAGYFKAFKGVKVIFDQHDLNPELYEAKYGRRDAFYHLLVGAERATFATADAVISTNESYREVALTRGRKAAEDVFIVRSGPDLRKFKPTIPNSGYKRGKRFLVGYLGVMGQQEGIDCLLRSIKHTIAVEGRADIHWMLIGNGPAFDELQALVQELGIGEHVEFTGRVGDAELLERLSSCDVCVNPDPKTPFNDKSTMNKILEYMALGKPIVQFDILEGRRSAASASLYASDEVDFSRKVLELLGDPVRRALMGQEGRRRMTEALEWAHQAPKLLAAYERALGRPLPAAVPAPAPVVATRVVEAAPVEVPRSVDERVASPLRVSRIEPSGR